MNWPKEDGRGTIVRHRITRTEVVIIVVVVIVTLAAIIVPVLGKAREKARRVNCAGNLKCMGLALLMYSGDNGGFFPNTVARGANQFGNASSEGYITSDGKIWACPSASMQRTTVANSNYIFVGSGLKDDNENATGVTVSHDASGNHPGNAWMNAMFIDGHVEGGRPDGSKGWNLN